MHSELWYLAQSLIYHFKERPYLCEAHSIIGPYLFDVGKCFNCTDIFKKAVLFDQEKFFKWTVDAFRAEGCFCSVIISTQAQKCAPIYIPLFFSWRWTYLEKLSGTMSSHEIICHELTQPFLRTLLHKDFFLQPRWGDSFQKRFFSKSWGMRTVHLFDHVFIY